MEGVSSLWQPTPFRPLLPFSCRQLELLLAKIAWLFSSRWLEAALSWNEEPFIVQSEHLSSTCSSTTVAPLDFCSIGMSELVPRTADSLESLLGLLLPFTRDDDVPLPNDKRSAALTELPLEGGLLRKPRDKNDMSPWQAFNGFPLLVLLQFLLLPDDGSL